MARTRNWTGVTFATNPMAEVQEVSFRQQNAVLYGSGDSVLYNTAAEVVGIMWMARVVSEDIEDTLAFDAGDGGSLVGIHKATGNFANTAESDDLTFTLSNAVCISKEPGGRHRAWGSNTCEFASSSSDGATDPLAVVVAA